MPLLAPRPCLSCGRLSAGARCPRCTSIQNARRDARKATTRRARQQTGNDAQRRTRAWLRGMDSWPCAHCGLAFPPSSLDVDHRRPLVDGGADTDENVQILCKPCHRAKTALEAHRRPKV